MQHGEEDDERRNGKQHCGNLSFLADSMVKKQRENTEENGTVSPLLLYNILFPINHYIGGSAGKSHSRSYE